MKRIFCTDQQWRYYSCKPFLEHKIPTLDDAVIEIEKRSLADEYIAVCLKESNKLIGELFNKKEEPETYSIGWNFNAK
ncbi:hypothetical protein AWM70_07970 [Paenibacillus yonginensis]|uniref:Uncharacterized protein n=1 Tax=Paenibacillus yonginensis TaxID=1462996 RepID=A0A1B1MZE5_9BACL|nr:hypothetical protein AWM70_07970 [Paenibacillus yonginensis]